MYEVRVHGSQYVVVRSGYDPLKHGGVMNWAYAKQAFGTRKAAERACETANAGLRLRIK